VPFATPADIRKKAASIYRKYLRAWINGSTDDFFPHRVGVSLSPAKDFTTARSQRETLLKSSKNSGKRGYTVHLREVQTRDFGKNLMPQRVTIDTLDDLLFLAGTEKDFAAACHVVDQVRTHLPELEAWLQQNVRTLHKVADRVEGLVAVARHFKEHPTREHYLRQLPIAVDTKFIEGNRGVLDAWLQQILPHSSIDLTQRDFSRRYGLPVAEGHWMLRVLDAALLPKLGLPFSELSLPLAAIAQLPLAGLTILITENRIPLLTLPELPGTIAVWGQGNAVVHLQSLELLHKCRLVYWGDLDVEGFQILARLRAHFPHTESILMDEATLEQHLQWKVDGTGAMCEVPENLTPEERVAFERCVRENWRVEQERVGFYAFDPL
jgi:hypothetical protein